MHQVLGKKSTIAVFVLPGFILFTAIMIVPIFASLSYSFSKWDGLNNMELIGIKNYQQLLLLNRNGYWIAVKNTGLIAFFTVLIQIPIALLLAILLAEGIKGEGIFRTVYFTPAVVSATVIGQLFLKIYNVDYGLLNVTLGHLGLENWRYAWLGNTNTALIALIIPIIWQYIGQHMLLLYSGIKAVPKEIFESARIDGANRRQMTFHITIPLIAPMLEVCTTLGVVGSIKIFDLSLILTSNGEPLGTTQLQSGLMYKQIFDYGYYGLGSATAMLIVAQCLVLTLVIQFIYKHCVTKER